MTKQNVFNVQLANKIANDLAVAEAVTVKMLADVAALPAYMARCLTGDDYIMQRAFAGEKSAYARVLDGLTHAAWHAFFAEHNAHHILVGRDESCLQYKYVFASSGKRDYYNGVKSLVPFTVDAAQQFFNEYLHVTPQRRNEWLKELLTHTGTSYRSANDLFKSKMTLRNLDPYNYVAERLCRTLYAVCLALDVEFTVNSFYCELRNNRKIDGVHFKVIDGLGLTLEWHQNGNTTLRLDKSLVEQLNAMLAGG